MSELSYVYKDVRPRFTIEATGGTSLGRCYSANYWRVTSKYRISRDDFRQLNNMGLVGFGQEFEIKSQCDGKEDFAFEVDVPCKAEDYTGKVVDENPANPYTGKPYQPIKVGYYVYECVGRVDSSD